MIKEQSLALSNPDSKNSVSAPPAGYDRVPTRFVVGWQRLCGRVLLLPFCGLLVLMIRVVGDYRIQNLKEFRKFYREACKSESPLMICANHLTFVDSALIIWALGSNFWYLFNWRRFSWNLPAGDFFKKKLYFRVIAYLTKCVFIHRDGTKRHQAAVLDLCRDLLLQGEVVTVFPEGKRSRSGRFGTEKFAYGVGKILHAVPGCRVLCLYLRAEDQETYSDYPRRHSRFHLEYGMLIPKTGLSGRDAVADLTHQVAQVIQNMENQYFSKRERANS
jgi:1-acyl-sn-glycerol-3-phosphate acyltransferase